MKTFISRYTQVLKAPKIVALQLKQMGALLFQSSSSLAKKAQACVIFDKTKNVTEFVRKMKVGITTIQNMTKSVDGKKNKKLRQYAAFLYLKSLYKKGCCYDYTQIKLAGDSGLSRASISRLVSAFIKYGWCHKHGENLMFKGRKHYKKQGFNKTFELQGTTIKEIINELYYIILKVKQGQLDKLKSVGRAIKTAKSSKVKRRLDDFLEKCNKKKIDLPSQNDTLRFSSLTLGKMFGCSKSQAHRIIGGLGKKVIIIKGLRRYVNKVRIVGSEIINVGCMFKNDCNEYKII